MTDADWLQHGHTDRESKMEVVFDGAALPPATRSTIREQVGGLRIAGTRRTTSKVASSAIVLAIVSSGVAGAVVISETLFPGLGQATAESVWQNPGRSEPISPVHIQPAPPTGTDPVTTTLPEPPPVDTSVPITDAPAVAIVGSVVTPAAAPASRTAPASSGPGNSTPVTSPSPGSGSSGSGSSGSGSGAAAPTAPATSTPATGTIPAQGSPPPSSTNPSPSASSPSTSSPSPSVPSSTIDSPDDGTDDRGSGKDDNSGSGSSGSGSGSGSGKG